MFSLLLQFSWPILKIYIRHKVHLSPWHKLSNLALVKLFIAMHNVINRSLPATILILEYSFFLSQQSTQESANTLELAAAEYGRSGTSAAVQKAVEDVLSEDHADHKEFWKIILDITLQNRMCGWHLFWRWANFILIASLLAKVAKEWEVQRVVEKNLIFLCEVVCNCSFNCTQAVPWLHLVQCIDFLGNRVTCQTKRFFSACA